MAWQDFIYFMWPAAPGQRGIPKPGPARLGDAGPTVWETYRTVDTVFLPDAQNPGPWNTCAFAGDASSFVGAAGRQRRGASLDDDVENLPRGARQYRCAAASAMPQNILDAIAQAGGGTLYDLNGNPVYYEVAMNEAQYDYIVDEQAFTTLTSSPHSRRPQSSRCRAIPSAPAARSR